VGKGKWQIVVPGDFESTSKEYRLGGKSYNRVTTTLGIIAKPELFNWAKRKGEKAANKILETRQAIGSHVHKLIEMTLSGKDVNLGSYELEIREGMCRFFEFNKIAKLKPEALEQRLWSNEYGYAGTADYIGKYTSPEKFLVRGHKAKFKKEAFVIGDWKTARSFYPSYWLQLAAYAMAFKELTGIEVDGVFIARIRDGKIKVKEMTYKELQKLFKVYLSALMLYEWKYQKKDWKHV